MPVYAGHLLKYPARASFLWFLGLVLVGSVLLRLPVCGRPERPPISTLDAVFTATSAACVTGLAVRSTPDDFSFVGQLVILGLIQLGGIGIITVTTLVTVGLGGGEGLRQRAIVAQTLGSKDLNLRRVLARVLQFAIAIEAVGFLALFARNLVMNRGQSLIDNLWESLFHSVSAFCNAGFALYDDSLTRYQGDWFVNFTIMTLIVLGGLGFPVLLDLHRNWRRWRRGAAVQLQLHTRIMLIGSAFLLLAATGGFMALEWNHALADMSPGRKVLVSCFQATTPRTAGFQTIDLTTLTDASLFLMIMLMLIGGGPCSAAGGAKVSTLMVLTLHAWSRFMGESSIRLFRRAIPRHNVESATATALLFGVVGVFALTVMFIVESATPGQFIDDAFEVASALGTVGLSLNYTQLIESEGRCVIIALMFLGRLGPISVAAALSRSERKRLVEYPPEELLIG